jgi:hypothetical protein
MLLRVTNFSGEMPQASPVKLPDNAAQYTMNCRFTGGSLSSFYGMSTAKANVPSDRISIYKMGQNYYSADKYWFVWTEDVDCIRGQIASDELERTFFSSANYTRKTNFNLATQGGTEYPVNYRDLGVPRPTSPPVATILSGTGEGTAEDRYYIYTYVTDWDEESEPSDASIVPVSVKTGQVVQVTIPTALPVGSFVLKSIRIYRTASGANATDWQLVQELPIGTPKYSDSKKATELAETIPSLDWTKPPVGLQGFVNLPNGIVAAYKGADLYFCEPYRPFTFPSKYMLTMDYQIMGLGVFGSSLIVTTKGSPYLVTGIDPSSMTSQKLEAQQACVSKRSVVSMGYGVIYASPDGLVLVDGNGVNIVTSALFTIREWRETKPETITACQYDGNYYAFTPDGGRIFDFRATPPIMTRLDVKARGTHQEIKTDSLFLIEGIRIAEWEGDSATRIPYVWKSKVFETAKHTTFGWCQVQAEEYLNVTITIYADFKPVYSFKPTSNTPFRLPSGFLSKFWEIGISGTSTINTVIMAQSIKEVQSV